MSSKAIKLYQSYIYKLYNKIYSSVFNKVYNKVYNGLQK